MSSHSSRRNEVRSARQSTDTIDSSTSKKKSSSRGDDRDRGFNPSSTSYSSTSQSQYTGVAAPSVASSYATAWSNNDEEPYIPPGLVRNASLAEKMPKMRSEKDKGDRQKAQDPQIELSRVDERRTSERSQSIDRAGTREKKAKRDKKEKRRSKDQVRGTGASGAVEISRGPADFDSQVENPSFSQFPGQYESVAPISNGTQHEAASSHVENQFPGQFPAQMAAPYRPPRAASEGGPGLAAEYYGDTGQSVSEQPGYRIQSPSLIIGAEPHLLPASSIAAPPPEPSASVSLLPKPP